MKKLLALLLVLTMTFSLAACGNKDTDKDKTTDENNQAVSENGDKDKDKDKDKETEEPAEKEKVLNLLEITNIPSLITWKATDQVSFQVLGNIESGLYILGLDGTPQPELAESYEVSPDGLTYTFHLREGVKWATVDGEEYGEVTADDFIFAWKKLLDPKEAAQYAVMIENASIKNGAEAVGLNNEIVVYEQKLKDLEGLSVDSYEDTEEATAKKQYEEAKAELEKTIAKKKAAIEENYGTLDEAKVKLNELIDNLAVTAVDKYTLKVELVNPVPYFLDLMTFASFFPVSEKFYNEVGAEDYGKTVDKFLYNGAYIFKEWKLSERHYLVKNPLYWDAENVDIDALDYRVIEGPNNDTMVQMYLDGEIDQSGLAGENVEKYGSRPDTVQLVETTVFYLDLNMNNGALTPTKKVLRDSRARKAINMAIEKSYITDIVLGNGSLPMDFFLPKGFVSSAQHDGKGFRKVAEDLYGGGEGYNRHNPEKAKELWEAVLADQGIDEVTFECIISTTETSAKMGTHIKDELEKNLPGATVELVILPFAERLKRTTNGDFSMSVGGWGPDYPDAMTYMDMWITGGAYNRGHYSNEAYDEGIELTKNGELTAPDKAKERFEKLVELEKVLLEEEQVIVPLFQRNRLALRNPKIKDLKLQQFGAEYLYKWAKIED
jgi:oligopeptide transport system substrate-binding protein